MVFFDTCVWIELCGVRTPQKPNEIKQAQLASTLLADIIKNKDDIVTCKEQLIEIISAIEKIKLREYNRTAKNMCRQGCGNVKEYRSMKNEFVSAKKLCKEVVDDVLKFANIRDCSYTAEYILQRIDLADINDIIYFGYCAENKINFYTFDSEITNLGFNNVLHILQ